MFRTAPVLLALLASGAAASECTVPKFHSSYAISGKARGTYESDSTNADFPDFLEVDLNSEAADKFGDQDGGFFTMVRDWDESGYYGKYACMITSSGGHALCTSLGDDIEEGPIMRMDLHVDANCLVSSYDSYLRDLAGPGTITGDLVVTVIAHGTPSVTRGNKNGNYGRK